MPSHRGASRAVESVCLAYDESNHDLRAVSMCMRHATAALLRLHGLLGEGTLADGAVSARVMTLGEAVDALSSDFLTLVDAIGMVRRREPEMAAVSSVSPVSSVSSVSPPVTIALPVADDDALALALERASEIFRRLSLHLAVRRETAGAPSVERDAEALAQTAALHALHDLAVDRVHADLSAARRPLVSASISVIVDALRGEV